MNENPAGTLEELREEITGETPAPGAEAETSESGQADIAKGILSGDIDLGQLVDKIGADSIAKLCIQHANKRFTDAGLTPMSELQETIIALGLAGTLEKYKDKLGGVLRPEIILAAGGAWVLAEKIMAAKALKKKKIEAAAQDPEKDLKEAA